MNKLVTSARALGPPGAVSRNRKYWALAVAGAADLAQGVFFPFFIEGALSPLDVGLDIVTGVVLVMVLGFRWRLVMAIAAELVPGLDLAPTWTAVVLSIPMDPKPSPALPEKPPPT